MAKVPSNGVALEACSGTGHENGDRAGVEREAVVQELQSPLSKGPDGKAGEGRRMSIRGASLMGGLGGQCARCDCE